MVTIVRLSTDSLFNFSTQKDFLKLGEYATVLVSTCWGWLYAQWNQEKNTKFYAPYRLDFTGEIVSGEINLLQKQFLLKENY